MNQACSRREFLKQTALTASALPLVATDLLTPPGTADDGLPPVHIFSKHLQFLDYADMADAVANMGFNGVDLTVRPAGHVLPERVEEDLPKAVDAIKKVGFTPDLITTAVGDVTEPVSVRVLKTAAALGFNQYRTKWYPYPENQTIPDAIKQFQQQLHGLGELNRSLRLTGCYQNHAGLWAGASIWELWQMLQTADPQFTGVQYDIRHATVEGGLSWTNGLKLIQPRIKSLTMKDFRWVKKGDKWSVEDVPFGEGMVDFAAYFRLLKAYRVRVPVTLHAEYPLGGADQGANKLTVPKEQVFTALKRDLNRLNELWLAA